MQSAIWLVYVEYWLQALINECTFYNIISTFFNFVLLFWIYHFTVTKKCTFILTKWISINPKRQNITAEDIQKSNL